MMRIGKLPVVANTIIAIATIISGCASSRPLMPTPLLLVESDRGAGFDETLASRRTPDADLLFITDRGPHTDPANDLPYGEVRSTSLAFGSTVVEIGGDMSWAELEQQSRLAERTLDVSMRLGRTDELGRFPEAPYELQATSAGIIRSPQVMQHHHRTRSRFEAELQRRLEQSPSKEVMLYIHGFNDTFATAAYSAADLCHFFGRRQVCAFFAWPASSSGFLLTAFNTTTESARFSVGHLKRSIRMIAQTPGVEGIQLLAHSRGADVLFSALRELTIEAVAAGIEPVDAFKIDNVVMMAPDIDADVAQKKWGTIVSDPDLISNWSSPVLPRILQGRFTIYASPGDRALIWATRLFRSRARVGNLTAHSLAPDIQRYLATRGYVDVIVFKGERTDRFGHSYFVTNPKVSSDLVHLVRFKKSPGEPGRPLEQVGLVTWVFPDI